MMEINRVLCLQIGAEQHIPVSSENSYFFRVQLNITRFTQYCDAAPTKIQIKKSLSHPQKTPHSVSRYANYTF